MIPWRAGGASIGDITSFSGLPGGAWCCLVLPRAGLTGGRDMAANESGRELCVLTFIYEFHQLLFSREIQFIFFFLSLSVSLGHVDVLRCHFSSICFVIINYYVICGRRIVGDM